MAVLPPGRWRAIRAIDRVRNNHYFTRSRAHYARKLARGDVNLPELIDIFERMDRNEVFDDTALIFRDRTRALMAAAGRAFQDYAALPAPVR